MQVDRALFLNLVTAIAAATGCPVACAASSGAERAPVTAPVVDVPAPPPTAPVVAHLPLNAAAPPPPVIPAIRLGIWSPEYAPAGPPLTCAMLKCGGPVNEGMWSLRKACKIYSEMLRPEPFQRFMGCLMTQNNTAKTCDLALVDSDENGCLEHWSAPPTVDPATAAKCRPVVESCAARRGGESGRPLSMEACQKMFSVTSAKYDRKMIHCAMEGCGTAPIDCYMAY
jgi:hypothetical protein